MQPVTQHLAVKKDKTPLTHLFHTLINKEYRIGFAATALLSIGGFMMMPFGSAFAINNLHITNKELPIVFMVAGISTLVFMPLIGKLSDKVDKLRLFAFGCFWTMTVILFYTQLGPTPLWLVIAFNILMMMGIMGRMVPSTAIVTGVPEMQDRGAFMSINTSLQQIAGGIAAFVAGQIVVQKTQFSPLEHYDTLGYIVSAITILSIFLMYRLTLMIKRRPVQAPVAQVKTDTEISPEKA